MAAALLASLRAVNVVLRLDGARLRYQAPTGALTPELRSAVAEHRAELVALLAAETAADVLRVKVVALRPRGAEGTSAETSPAVCAAAVPPVAGASFVELAVEVLLRGDFGDVWLVPKATGTRRPELTPADVEVIRLVQAEFPGARVVSIQAPPRREERNEPSEGPGAVRVSANDEQGGRG